MLRKKNPTPFPLSISGRAHLKTLIGQLIGAALADGGDGGDGADGDNSLPRPHRGCCVTEHVPAGTSSVGDAALAMLAAGYSSL